MAREHVHVHPPVPDPDHDELDFLPSLSPAPAPTPAPRDRNRAATRPTSRDSPHRSSANAALHTPLASPHGAHASTARRDGARTQRLRRPDPPSEGAHSHPWADEAVGEAHSGLRRSSSARGSAQREEGDGAGIVLDDHAAESASSKRRRRSLTFKPSLSQPEGDSERHRRARQRAQADPRIGEHVQERWPSTSPTKERVPAKAPRRRALVLDDEEDDEDAAAAAPTPVVRVKPDPEPAAAVLVLDGPSPSAASRAGAHSNAHAPARSTRSAAGPLPARAPPSPTTASPREPSSLCPSVSTFLLSLALPSLSRLAPLFHGLGLCTPPDLVQLASPSASAARARAKVLDRVDRMDRATRGQEAGGLSTWERIVLEEELAEVWRQWGNGEADADAEA
ncbi:hypothetical protein JCM3770_006944 [Rhodotorula araucariae]